MPSSLFWPLSHLSHKAQEYKLTQIIYEITAFGLRTGPSNAEFVVLSHEKEKETGSHSFRLIGAGSPKEIAIQVTRSGILADLLTGAAHFPPSSNNREKEYVKFFSRLNDAVLMARQPKTPLSNQVQSFLSGLLPGVWVSPLDGLVAPGALAAFMDNEAQRSASARFLAQMQQNNPSATWIAERCNEIAEGFLTPAPPLGFIGHGKTAGQLGVQAETAALTFFNGVASEALKCSRDPVESVLSGVSNNPETTELMESLCTHFDQPVFTAACIIVRAADTLIATQCTKQDPKPSQLYSVDTAQVDVSFVVSEIEKFVRAGGILDEDWPAKVSSQSLWDIASIEVLDGAWRIAQESGVANGPGLVKNNPQEPFDTECDLSPG